MKLTIGKIAEIVGGRLVCGDPATLIGHIAYDSRTMRGDDLFIPVKGERVDGHDFIASAFTNGAAATFCAREDVLPAKGSDLADKPFVQVEDPTAALQKLGVFMRDGFGGKVIGITGSVGKTTTREMTMAALRGGGSVTGSEKNLNSQLGVPVTLCHMDETADFAVLEMGISIPGEMVKLTKMVRPKTVILTNIGVAHIEYLGSREGICEEKMHIADLMGPEDTAILNGDEPLLREAAKKAGCRTLFYGLEAGNDVTAENIELGDTAEFTAVLGPKVPGGARRIPVALSVPGSHNVMNALAALTAAAVLGVDAEAAALSMQSFGGFSRRLERFDLGTLHVIDDSYNASPVSMKAALEVLCRAKGGRKIAALADMRELGKESASLHREVGTFAAALPVDVFVTLGHEIAYLEEPLKAAGKNLIHAESPEDAADILKKLLAADDVLLLKGSNTMGLDKVRKLISE